MQLRELRRGEDVAVAAEVDERRGLDELVLAQVVADLLVPDAGVRVLGKVREDVEVGVDLGQVEDRHEQHGREADGDGERALRDRAREAREEAARLALVLLPGVQRPEEVVAEDRQQGRRQRQRGEQGHGDRDGDPRAHRRDHLEVADAHGHHADDHRARGRGDDRTDALHGDLGGVVPVGLVRDLLAVAADQEDRVVRPHAEDHHDEERLQGGGHLPAGGREEPQHALRHDERRADGRQRDERRERRPVDQQQDDDDEDDRDDRRAVGARLDGLEVVRADGRGAGDVGLEALRRGRAQVLAQLLDHGLGLVARVRDVEVDHEQLERPVIAAEQLLELGP